jgi:hypothetical protein
MMCKKRKHNASYDMCFVCSGFCTVVYDIGGTKEEREMYFKKHKGYIRENDLPSGIRPNEEREIFLSDLIKIGFIKL